MDQSAFSYPQAVRDDNFCELIHGHKIHDKFRSLEDPDSSSTQEWVDQQNDLTQRFLAEHSTQREDFQSKIERLLDFDRYSSPWKRGKYFYYTLQKGLSNQPVVMQTEALDVEPRVFLDPNTMSEDGTTSVATTEWSFDGNLLAYGVNVAGSDWEEIRIMDVNTLETHSEVLEWAKFTSVAWTSDGNGFYYARYPEPPSLKDTADKGKRGSETDEARNQAIYYHVVGTPQSEDRLVFTDPTFPKRIYVLHTTFDGRYLLVVIAEDCSPKSVVWYADLDSHFGTEGKNLIPLIGPELDAEFSYMTNEGVQFYFRTNWKAPNNRIIVANLHKPPSEWKEVLQEHPRHVLTSARAVDSDKMALVYMEDVKNKLSIHALRTGKKLCDIQLPDLGAVVRLYALPDQHFFTYTFTSFLYPGTVYYFEFTEPLGSSGSVFCQMSPPGFDPSLYRTRQVFYISKDGVTKVPMFIIESKNKERVRSPPCLLYGYGGFCISLAPYYSVRWVSWLTCLGGVVAVANLRGGNEYGENWHNQGIVANKQNVFDDFQWAARALTGELQVTTRESLLIMGGSNGGLLVGACINQAPELYGAAIAHVGVMDMLRFHKFTIGSAWVSDYGDPDKEEDFKHLIKYSPLHNVFSPDELGVAYPAVLLTTGDHDDRVVPLHTLKFGATLQHVAGSSPLQNGRPLLLRIDVKAGHGAGKPTKKVVEEICDNLLFAAITLKVGSKGVA